MIDALTMWLHLKYVDSFGLRQVRSENHKQQRIPLSAAFESVERDLRRVKMRNVEIHSLVSAESRKRESFPWVE